MRRSRGHGICHPRAGGVSIARCLVRVIRHAGGGRDDRAGRGTCHPRAGGVSIARCLVRVIRHTGGEPRPPTPGRRPRRPRPPSPPAQRIPLLLTCEPVHRWVAVPGRRATLLGMPITRPTGGELGQASVELVALLPLIAVLTGLLWQGVPTGQAVW